MTYCAFCHKSPLKEKRDKYCNRDCYRNGRMGMRFSDDHKLKLRLSKLGKQSPKKGVPQLKTRGEKNHFWRGGVTSINAKIRESLEYDDWRRKVFERDLYTCQLCGEIGGRLEADHIKPFSLYPDLRFDLSNGRTLCKICHKKTDTYGHLSLKRNNKGQFEKNQLIN